MPPASRTVHAKRVYRTSGSVGTPTAVLKGRPTTLTGTGSSVTLDFGEEVGGIVTVHAAPTTAAAQQLGLVRRVYPADELEERTAAFCQRVALNPLDGLTVHKHVTNRWLEVMEESKILFFLHKNDAKGLLSHKAGTGEPLAEN